MKGVKISAGVIAVAVIVLFVLAGPANAFILGLTISDSEIVVGDEVSFIASAEIEDGEVIPINAFILDLSNGISITCTFLPDGTKISSCNGISIQKISDANFSFGYGYNGYTKGILSYNITLNTTHIPAGLYSTKLIAIAGNDRYDFEGGDIRILGEAPRFESCSVRADDGGLNVGETFFNGRTKLNFNIPKSNAATKGKGTLTSQSGDRFSYKFDVVKILENEDDIVKIQTQGSYKIGRGEDVETEAVITVDKSLNLINVDSEDFSAQDLLINFIKGC